MVASSTVRHIHWWPRPIFAHKVREVRLFLVTSMFVFLWLLALVQPHIAHVAHYEKVLIVQLEHLHDCQSISVYRIDEFKLFSVSTCDSELLIV